MTVSPSDIQELIQAAFRQEGEELLGELDSALLQLEASPTDGDLINRAFRALHTLKGAGAMSGFTEVSAVVHDVEGIFTGARDGRVRITSQIIDLVLKVGDVVRRMLSASRSDGPRLLEEGMKLVGDLKAVVAQAAAEVAPTAPAIAPGAAVNAAHEAVEGTDTLGLWSVHFAPDTQSLRRGIDPLSILSELLSLGHGVVRASTERLFAEPAFDPELCYLSWDAQLATSQPRERIAGVFLRVQAESEVRVEPLASERAWALPVEAYFEASMVSDFREEAGEDITEIEQQVLALEEDRADAGRKRSLKRALHNLKGVSQLLLSDVRRSPPPRHPLRAMSELCHAAESFLEGLAGAADAPLPEDASDVLLETVDWLKALLRALDVPRDEWPTELLERLGADEPDQVVLPVYGRGGADPLVRSVVEQCDDVVRAVTDRRSAGGAPSSDDWTMLARALGTLEKATAFSGAASTSEQVQTLVTMCESSSRQTEPDPLAWDGFCERYRSLTHVVEDPPEAAAARPSIRYKARTVSLRPSRPSPRLSRAPQGPAPAAAPAGTAPAHSVRVDQEKLDTLMGAIGELLVAKNALPVLIARIGGSAGQAGKEIKATVDRIAHITDDLQDAMRQIRMMPIRSVSQRFPRMIRDLARSQSKQVQLIISGDEIELDKTVLEHIGDPLVHLVRNAVDHGLEPPDQRLARGKPEMGTVGFTALKEGSHVVIRISDDGRGMSPERLRAKAVEKGLLSQAEAAELSDKRALELILLPGLSTAEVVTDISGRGVGMDVVQSNIRQLHGTIAITSEPGHGSAISIKLPTSLMVSKGMLVECGSEQYVLPIEGVREMVKFRCDQVRRFRDVAMMSVRGTICPVYSLGRLLGLEQKGGTDGALFDAEEASAAIVSTQTGDIAVVVDRLVAEIDVIVKPLSGGLDKLMLFQGATILGDGSVALIIDVRRLDALTALDGARDPGAAAVAASA